MVAAVMAPAAGQQLSESAAAPTAAASEAAPAASRPRAWVSVPPLRDRLRVADLGLLINTGDPYSIAVGDHYIRARRLLPHQVLRLKLPTAARLTRQEFESLRQAVEMHFGPATQALALAWAAPYAVECNSITGALALGFDPGLCNNGCAASRSSGYFNSASTRPLVDPGWRPSMLLAAPSVEQALALIDRGVAADGSLRGAGRAPVSVLLLLGDDRARGIRSAFYPPGGLPPALGVDIHVAPEASLAGAQRLLMVAMGSDRLGLERPLDWVPGALAPPDLLRRRLAGRAWPVHRAGLDGLRGDGQSRRRQRALQPCAEVSAPAGAAVALPAGRHGDRGLLEERGLAAAELVRRRTAGGAVRRVFSCAAPLKRCRARWASR